MKNRLKELRARHNITQQELATNVGVSRQSINAIENGDTTPAGDTMLKIANYFNMNASEVFELNEKEV